MNCPSREFDWDEANRNHLTKHDVTPQEAEEVVLGDPLDTELQIVEGSGEEERLLQLGETAKGRILQLLTTWRGGKVRVFFRMGCAKATQVILPGRNEAALWRH
jgi:hypothetical protein